MMQPQATPVKRKIRLQPSPYAYVRTVVMRSSLFKAHDYAKMVKMQLSEIIQFLEESSYKREIDELAVSESGVQLIEHSVHRNFRRAVEKLHRISDENIRYLVDIYLWRNDIQNIKTILRAKLGNEPKSKVQNMFVPGTIKKEQLLQYYDLATLEDMLSRMNHPLPVNMLAVYKSGGLPALESELTKAYYKTTFAAAKEIRGGGDALKEFLQLEVDMMNITTIFKLKRENATPEHIEQYLIRDDVENKLLHITEQTRSHFLDKLVKAKNLDECFALLEKTPFRHAIGEAQQKYAQTGSLLQLERNLQSYLLKYTTRIAHKHPLSADIVLSYLFAKVNEIRNIFMLIKGKQLGVPESFLEEELVIYE
jgi:V/A-type H+/Na+-transporting ATPase subunit C